MQNHAIKYFAQNDTIPYTQMTKKKIKYGSTTNMNEYTENESKRTKKKTTKVRKQTNKSKCHHARSGHFPCAKVCEHILYTFEYSFSSDNIFCCCGKQRDKYWVISNQGKVNVYSVSH